MANQKFHPTVDASLSTGRLKTKRVWGTLISISFLTSFIHSGLSQHALGAAGTCRFSFSSLYCLVEEFVMDVSLPLDKQT